jgi:heptosyltransferase-1
MKRILIVKLSSMGDVIHALPILSDIKNALGDVSIDWLTEPAYACLLESHPLINRVLTVPLRKHKGHLLQFYKSQEAQAIRKYFKSHPYDVIIDAQGLLKSALLSRWAKGTRCGYDKNSCREPLSSRLMHRRFAVAKDQHAVTRMRQLAAQALDYPCPTAPPDYQLNQSPKKSEHTTPTIMLMPFTTWPSKHWPQAHWQSLIKQLAPTNNLLIAWGSQDEKQQADNYCQDIDTAQPIPPSSIADMKSLLENCDAFIAVDTGFAHLATALDLPGIALMGPTDKRQSGPLGSKQFAMDINLPCRPCHKRICPLTYQAEALRPACMADIKPENVAAFYSNLISKQA